MDSALLHKALVQILSCQDRPALDRLTKQLHRHFGEDPLFAQLKENVLTRRTQLARAQRLDPKKINALVGETSVVAPTRRSRA